MGKKIASCQTLHFSGEDQRWEQAILFLRRYYYLTSGGSQSYMYATQKMSLALGGMQRWRKGSASCSYGLSSFHQPLLLLLVQMRLQDLPAVWVVRVHPVDLNRGQKLGVYQLGLVWSLHITQPKKKETRHLSIARPTNDALHCIFPKQMNGAFLCGHINAMCPGPTSLQGVR